MTKGDLTCGDLAGRRGRKPAPRGMAGLPPRSSSAGLGPSVLDGKGDCVANDKGLPLDFSDRNEQVLGATGSIPGVAVARWPPELMARV